MNFHLPHNTRRRDPKLIAGLILLPIANSMHYMLPRMGFANTDALDLATGALMGAAIGLLLWALATSRCRQPQ